MQYVMPTGFIGVISRAAAAHAHLLAWLLL
jgi:hypothetical protein